MTDKKKTERDMDERSPELKGDLEARPDELEADLWEIDEAGHGAELEQLSPVEEASEKSVEELAATNQSVPPPFEGTVAVGSFRYSTPGLTHMLLRRCAKQKL
jgi:hypothetical protein